MGLRGSSAMQGGMQALIQVSSVAVGGFFSRYWLGLAGL